MKYITKEEYLSKNPSKGKILQFESLRINKIDFDKKIKINIFDNRDYLSGIIWFIKSMKIDNILVRFEDRFVIEKYDKLGNQIYKKDLKGNEFYWRYDENNNLIYQKYPNGDEYFWEYDENNNFIYKKYPDGDEDYWEYKYDQNNNLVYKKYPDGREYFWEYDENNNCIYERDYDGNKNYWRYDYDKDGVISKIYENNKLIFELKI